MQAGNVLHYSNVNHKPNKMLSKAEAPKKPLLYCCGGCYEAIYIETFFYKQL